MVFEQQTYTDDYLYCIIFIHSILFIWFPHNSVFILVDAP